MVCFAVSPNCRHEGESLNNPHPTCGGWVEGINTTCPMTIGEHLYFLYTPEETSGGGYAGFNIKKLCRADKDGYFTIDAVTGNYIYVSRIRSGRSVIGVMEKEKFLSGRVGEIRYLKTF